MGLVVALSGTTTSLLAALLGAVVGGVATLAGSTLVNRWDRAMDARLRLYDQLIPQANDLRARLAGPAGPAGPAEWIFDPDRYEPHTPYEQQRDAHYAAA